MTVMPDPHDVLTRPAPPPHATIRYGLRADNLADVWFPDGDAPAPLVIVVHGGFWRASFDRRHTRPMCHALAVAGFTVAAIEYRRTGGANGWPAMFDDVAVALESVPKLVTDLDPGRCDSTRIVHAGHSAGGQLTVWAASRHRLPPSSRWHSTLPDPSVRGVVSLAGVLDVASAAHQRLGDGAAQDLLGGEPEDVPESYADIDPIRLAPAGVPVALVHGDADDRVPVDMSRRYAQRAGTGIVELPGAGHFDLIDPESSAWPRVVTAVTALIDGADPQVR